MAVPPVPAPLEALGERPFSFYPPIVNLEHNEWRLLRATWSEVLVENTRDGLQVWVPRRYLGEVSAIDRPVLIVGLTRQFEYAAGQLQPHGKRVIEIPKSPLRPPPGEQAVPSPAPGKRPESLETAAESRIGKTIALSLIGAIILCVLLVAVFRSSRDGSRVVYRPVLQSELHLTAADDYHAVVRRLGRPASERWRSDQGELQYRILEYPKAGMSVILMGSDRDNAKYVGAVDREWHVVDSVSLRGGDTAGLLRSLKRF